MTSAATCPWCCPGPRLRHSTAHHSTRIHARALAAAHACMRRSGALQGRAWCMRMHARGPNTESQNVRLEHALPQAWCIRSRTLFAFHTMQPPSAPRLAPAPAPATHVGSAPVPAGGRIAHRARSSAAAFERSAACRPPRPRAPCQGAAARLHAGRAAHAHAPSRHWPCQAPDRLRCSRHACTARRGALPNHTWS